MHVYYIYEVCRLLLRLSHLFGFKIASFLKIYIYLIVQIIINKIMFTYFCQSCFNNLPSLHLIFF